MSHFARIRTQMREREFLTQALEDLNYSFEEGEALVIRGWGGANERAQIKIPGASYDIGFRQQAGAYEAVADWWGVDQDARLGPRVVSEQEFVGEVAQRYGYLKAVELLEESGYELTEEHEEEGEIVLEAVRYY